MVLRSSDMRPLLLVALAALAAACRGGNVSVADSGVPDAPSPRAVRSDHDERSACAEIVEGGSTVVDVYCRHHADPCCLDAGAYFGWNCNNAPYAEWHMKTCR